MLRSLRVLLLGASLSLSAGILEAQQRRYLAIAMPEDMQSYKPGAVCKVTGVLQVGAETDLTAVFLRCRILRPANRNFVVDQEGLATLKKREGEPNAYLFEASLTLPKERGRYLLRVDWIDLKVPKYPKSLIATQSLFINVEAPEKKNTVTINQPKTNTQFGTGSSISVGGTSTSDKVVGIQISFVLEGTLDPPMEGWPKGGNPRITAVGLDAGSAQVTGENDFVSITIVD